MWLLVNIAVTVALVPALFTAVEERPAGPVAVTAGSTLRTLPVVATAEPGDGSVVVLGPTDVAAAATTTTTTAPPPTTTTPPTTTVRAAPPTTVRPRVAAPPTTVARPTTTTTTAPPRTQSGKASWYDHQAGVCAHRSLPFGTVVTVTSVASGRSTTCTVGDRGPYVEGWVIDLHPREFEQLAPRSAGVISVRLRW